MILRTDDLRESCTKILSAVDSNALNSITDMLEINCGNGIFSLSVSNGEYYVKIQTETDVDEEFKATVNAIQFLKLVEKTTSEVIELTSDDKVLNVTCNGSYKIPLVYDGDSLLKIPTIDIDESVEKTSIKSSALKSIVDFNSKELTKGIISKPVQRLYYVDGSGCITFTTGACVNEFKTNVSSNLLFNDKLVKLFKLFGDEEVELEVGHNAENQGLSWTVVKFTTKNVQISAITGNDQSLLQSYPVEAIRNRAHAVYPYRGSLNKFMVNQAIDRISIFADHSIDSISGGIVRMKFTKNSVTISDFNNVNKETVEYVAPSETAEECEIIINSRDFTKTLSSCTNQIVNIFYGDEQAILVKEGAVYWVIPQCSEE